MEEAFSCFWHKEIIRGNTKRICEKCGKRICAKEQALVKDFGSEWGEQTEYYHTNCAQPILLAGVAEIKKLIGDAKP